MMRTFWNFFAISLIFFPLMVRSGSLQAAPPQKTHSDGKLELHGCAIRLDLEGKDRIERKNRNGALVSRRIKELRLKSGNIVQILMTCLPNKKRTSRISEIKASALRKNHRILGLKMLIVDGTLPGVYFARERLFRGRKLTSIEGYFATREQEYFFTILPETQTLGKRRRTRWSSGKTPALSRKQTDLLTEEMGRLLNGVTFTVEVDPAITEAGYRTRLAIFQFLLGSLGLLAAFFLIRSYRRKQIRKRETEKREEARVPDEEKLPENREKSADGIRE